MKCSFAFLFVVIFSNAQSQAIEKYFDFWWNPCNANEARYYSNTTKTDSGYVRNDYFIREKRLQMSGKFSDEDCKVKNGYFTYYHSNGYLQSEGVYVNNLKEGLWLRFHNNGMMSDSTVYRLDKIIGTSLSWHANGFISDSVVMIEDGRGVNASWFENGNPSFAGLCASGEKQHGTWKYYHNNGAISSVEVYDNGKLLSKTFYDEAGKMQKDTSNIDKEAVFAEGKKAWIKYLATNANFPSEYKIVNGNKATVVVAFEINEEGNVENAFVDAPFSPEFDKLALNTIKNSPKWKPAIEHNRRVKARLKQPITYMQTGE
jgi:TonB family protein